jgi:hypothetical protein|tara:strand:- start:104 stop:424 length:321 start_codon:yes stop_codon:yes gene_type:complete
MEINDFKPKDPADTPGTESPTAVKEAVVEEAPVEDEVTVEEKPVLTIEGQTINPTELAESLVELKDRAKAAGLRPIQNMVVSYLNQGLSMVDGLLESLEGSKKKDK